MAESDPRPSFHRRDQFWRAALGDGARVNSRFSGSKTRTDFAAFGCLSRSLLLQSGRRHRSDDPTRAELLILAQILFLSSGSAASDDVRHTLRTELLGVQLREIRGTRRRHRTAAPGPL